MTTQAQRLTSFANQCLQDIVARSTIASLTEVSVEAENFNLAYERIRNQVLGMAYWGFARRTEALSLLKAAPGTPENNTIIPAYWNSDIPAPPWLYEYRYPNDCAQFHYLGGQINNLDTTIPIFPYGNSLPFSAFSGIPPSRYIKATDDNIRAVITGVTQASPGVVSCTNLFANGDQVTIADIVGMVELNANTYTVRNRTGANFTLEDQNGNPVDTTTFTAYVSGGTARSDPQTVLLTNAARAIGTFTAIIPDPADWSGLFYTALLKAMGGTLALAISGDKVLARSKYAEANDAIMEARAMDANEGLTIQNYIPETLLCRGYGDVPDGTFFSAPFAPYNNLFSVA